MANNENTDLKVVRINVKLTNECKSWYAQTAQKYGMTMSQYITYILSKHKENEENVSILKRVADFSNPVEGNSDVGKILGSAFLKMLKELENEDEKNETRSVSTYLDTI